MEEANKLIGTGKKHLVLGKVVEAVSALQEACGLLAKKYGDTADECGEAFYWCGKALLDLSRMENSVLGNALEGVPEEEEDKEKPKDSNVEGTENIDEKTRDELRVQVYDAMAEKQNEKDGEKVEGKPSEDAEKNTKGDVETAEAADGQEKPAKEKGAEEEEEEEEKKKSEASGSKSAGSEAKKEKECEKEGEDSADKPEEAEDAEEEEEEGEEDDGDDVDMEGDAQQGDAAAEKESDDDEEEEEEEVGNLQLAWEMLEVAKVIYKRKESKDDQLMAAQAHLKLGEVSAESGNYTQALEDFQECLKLQVKHLDSDSRLLAETHYQLGLTYSLDLQYRQAVDELNSSICVIKSRLGKLQQLLDKSAGPEALPGERKEMEELKALLPEIQEKVEDATEGLKTASTACEALKGALGGASTSSAFAEAALEKGDAACSSKVNSTFTNGVASTNGHTATAPVSNISHLVRKKRKPEESPVKEGAVKKVKQGTNGVDKATNGHTASMEVESQ
ncbi:putative histone-binding protein N1/N2-like [Scophthalmus maximus]|uniref:Putative histone-binding protein N1/N2-like n=1 Tax=Scophthalmus maximus TaxID=52904 RepID=A0A2U9BK53_SCOMX|nr:putative histone-binding protein N1/N2-like [Scophthalmus maximus]